MLLAAASSSSFPIVSVGAAAGGPFASLLAGVSADPAMAFVLVPQPNPRHESRFFKILSGSTTQPIAEAKEGTPVGPAGSTSFHPTRIRPSGAGCRMRQLPADA